MIRLFACMTLLAGLVGCQSPPAYQKAVADEMPMRHGWTVFTGPKPTATREIDSGAVERGKLVYTNHCAGCHGESGKGDGEIAKVFSIHPANLQSLSGRQANHYLVFQINRGKGSMPRWQDLLTPQQTWDVTAYIQSLSQKAK